MRTALALAFAFLLPLAARAQLVHQLPWSGNNALLSVDDLRGGIARSADDFVLDGAPGTVFNITRIRAVILIENIPHGPSSRIEIYDDNGAGAPAEFPLHVFPTVHWTDLGIVAIDPAYRAWEVAAGDGIATLFTQQAGVRRWICAIGTHTLPFPSGRYFAAFDEVAPAAGLGAAMRLGDSGPWDADSCSCLCNTDLAFSIDGAVSAASTECPADADHSGLVEVADIFSFLACWFASMPEADFDRAGGVDVQDVFAFLGAWFEGC